MKCPYCHVDFKSSVAFHVHREVCAYADNPLPEPEEVREPSSTSPSTKQTNTSEDGSTPRDGKSKRTRTK